MATMRRAEAFWIEKKQYWQIKVQKDGVRKGFTSSTKGKKGKREAEAKADEWLEKGTTDMRLEAAWQIFYAYKKMSTGTSNQHNLEFNFKNHILPVVNNRKLSSITPIMWQMCIDIAASKGLSAKTCAIIRRTIISFLLYARKSRWEIARIESGDLVIPKNAKPPKQKKVLQPDEIRILFSDDTYRSHKKIVSAYYINAWRLMVATGLRRGEIAGLQKGDISGNTMQICRSVNKHNEITNGKNPNARRTIEINAVVRKILSDQQQLMKNKGIISKWIFCSPNGNMTEPIKIYNEWLRYSEQHGMRTTLHELRHTFISINKADLPLELMKNVVGHSASMNTFGVYGHEIDGERHRAAEITNTVLTDILNGND